MLFVTPRVRVHPFQRGQTGAPKPTTVYMAEVYDDQDPVAGQVWACGDEHESWSQAESCGKAELSKRQSQ
jgi:hypothetical protein